MNKRISDVDWAPDFERVEDLDERGAPLHCVIQPRAGSPGPQMRLNAARNVGPLLGTMLALSLAGSVTWLMMRVG